MKTDQANEWFDDCAWSESMRFLPNLDHKDFWVMYCMGAEL